ncbi:MAG: class I SAM-dependent methyltransferase [Myxococcales bacterium]|nr:class I SAM-dependent methyltransferase [Myxococcales bacterium]MCB9520277.1 class I SAM-dependent methyltransferase [Myxococcales bacterium]MCB9531355.1 class I SAM-dependent methyltransferase [Myxococcales bacterium]MCB9533572.1 class I SAM-dependent methyltransferase [Myxococcales bacterium]
MGKLLAAIYDPFMRETERECLGAWRHELLQGISGNVLEVGAGTGANLAYYPTSVTRLTLAEPDAAMRARLVDAVRSGPRPDAHVIDASLAGLPFGDGELDVVVATLVLCSVADPAAALAEIRRVLAPDGAFVFLEHVIAEGHPTRALTQRALDPVWHHVAGGCHLTRDTRVEIERAGFEFESLTRQSMRRALPFLRPTVRGVARPA